MNRKEFHAHIRRQAGDTASVVTVRGAGPAPLDLYRTLSARFGASGAFLFESALRNSRTGRYSLIGFQNDYVFRSSGFQVEIECGKRRLSYRANPIEEVRFILAARRRTIAHDLPFIGGAAGFFSYDANRLFQKFEERPKEPSGCPDIYLAFCRNYVLYDHARGLLNAVAFYDPDDRDARAETAAAQREICALLERPVIDPPRGASRTDAVRGTDGVKANMSKRQYIDMVLRAKEYIAAGDIYQANLSQRLDVRAECDGLELYRAVTAINPSPFAAYLDCGGFEVVCCSPERLIRKEGDFIQTRPIAGTRPRGRGEREDFAMRSELLLSEKERAEHIMLVDLERNDLGRVAHTGSVEVDEFMTVEPYSHVQHIVSNVRAIVRPGVDFCDAFQAVFPGGTVTGVPKLRCMEIIDELEPSYRGLYTGSIGYISDNGDYDLNIVIRTILKRGELLSAQVGAGIVADSDPQREYGETLSKAAALLSAIDMTLPGRVHGMEMIG